MAETIVQGVDISGYQLKPPADYYLSLAQEGVKVTYVQAWGGQPGGVAGPNKYAEQQLRGFRTAGMQTGIYFWLPAGKDPEAVAAAGLLTAGDELTYIDFTVVDIEASLPSREALSYLVTRLEQLKHPVAIYCRANSWPYGPIFSDCPLIEARYVLNSGSAPRTPPYLDWHWSAFGGWTQRAGLQYAGTVDKYGVGTDLNVISLDRLGIKKGGETHMGLTAVQEKTLNDIAAAVKREEDVYVKMEGTDPIYRLDEAEQRLIHAVNPSVYSLQTPGAVKVLPPTHPVWKLTTEYQGVPDFPVRP